MEASPGKGARTASVNYLDCAWLSDSSLDAECLFVGGKYALKLQAIRMLPLLIQYI